MDAKALVLLAAFRHTINEPNIEAAFERLQAITGDTIDYDAFRDVVSAIQARMTISASVTPRSSA